MSKPEANIFILSDNHFLHDNIIGFCNRPFTDVNEMDEKMRIQWNSTVRENDIVICVGDFVWTKGSSENIKEMIKKLNGRIILVRGNHDKKGNSWYLNNGVDFICDRFVWDFNGRRILFVHDPLHVIPDEVARYDFIVHGHCHGNVPFVTKKGDCTFVNVSVEHLKYRPMALIPLLNRLTQGYYESR